MGRFDAVKEKYISKGISIDNIEYAISAVKDGGKREHIIEGLTADYRGVNEQQSIALLEDLFKTNGGEFKKENRGGYLYGTFLLMIGLGFSFYIFYVFSYGGTLVRPILIFAGAIAGIVGGLFYFIKSLMGKYRDSDEPFKD